MTAPFTLKQLEDRMDEKGIQGDARLAIIRRVVNDPEMGAFAPTTMEEARELQDVTVPEALFPRATGRAIEEDEAPQAPSLGGLTGGGLFSILGPALRSVVKEKVKEKAPTAFATTADVLSLPGRGIAGSLEALRQRNVQRATGGEDPQLLESIARTEAKPLPEEAGFGERALAFGEDVLRDPGTGAAALTTPVAGPILAKGRGAPLLTKVLRGAQAGAVEGTAAAAGEQVGRLGEGKEVDPTQAILTTILSSATGGAAPVAGLGLSKAGTKILEAVIKPSKPVKKAGFKLENLTGREITGSLRGQLKKVNKKINDADNKLDEILEKYPNTRIDMMQVLNRASKELSEETGQGLHADVSEQIQNGIELMIERAQIVNPDLKFTAQQLRNFKGGTGKAGKFEAGARTASPTGKQVVANKLFDVLRRELNDLDPQISSLNKEMSDLIPIQRALQEADDRISKNFPFSLSDLITGSTVAGSEAKLLPSIFGSVVRASKSPRVGARLSKTGRALEQPGAKTQASLTALKRFLAEGAQTFREEE